jgi:hypothetical protein
VSRWTKCTVASCLRMARCRGLCEAHYKRLRYGKAGLAPERPIRSPKMPRSRACAPILAAFGSPVRDCTIHALTRVVRRFARQAPKMPLTAIQLAS